MAIRELEAARKAEERALNQAIRAEEAERKQFEKEAKLAHVAQKEAEVEVFNLELKAIEEDLEGLLEATLDVDDFVDLESLRVRVEHPPFHRKDLEMSLPPPMPVMEPEVPKFENPEPSKIGTFLLGPKWRKKKITKQKEMFKSAHSQWEEEMNEVHQKREILVNESEVAEAERLQELEKAMQVYRGECDEREQEVKEQNQQLDDLIVNLGYGTKEAVEEYILIVLSNSVYPDHFPVNYEFEFEGASAELKLFVQLPPPSEVNPRKAYKYIKSRDEITEVMLSQKALRERYTSAVHQVSLRTLHEVFEADRRGIIQTISLEVGVNASDPATGQGGFLTFVAIGASRDAFLEIELANIVPLSTLQHLGAALSKDPHNLKSVSAGGVRKAK